MYAAAGPSRPLPPKPPIKADLARSHLAHTSIRAQTAKQRQQKSASKGDPGQAKQQGKGKGDGAADVDPLASKEVIRAVLVNPLMPRWPEVAVEYQKDILKLLCNSTSELSAYHNSRDRANRKRKDNDRKIVERERRDRARSAETFDEVGKRKAGPETFGGDECAMVPDSADDATAVHEGRELKRKADEVALDDNGRSTSKRLRKIEPPLSRNPPAPPEILQHMVIGINEVVKHMEKQMVALKEQFHAGRAIGPDAVLQTDGATDVDGTTNGTSMTHLVSGISKHSAQKSYVRIIFVCLSDLNPRHLVEPIPQYCTSWNSLVSQCRSELQRIIGGKTKEELKGRRDVMSMARAVKDAMEVLLVPLPEGAEVELAKATGLKRVAIMAFTTSFPDLSTMLKLLLQASLKPLRPPFPLHPTATSSSFPYAPLHIKAIATTTPVDPKAKKVARLQETREKRKEASEKRKNQNEKWRREEKLIKNGMPARLQARGGKTARASMEQKEAGAGAGAGASERVAGITVAM